MTTPEITGIIVALLLGLVGGFLTGQSRGARQRAEIDNRLQQEAQRDADRIRARRPTPTPAPRGPRPIRTGRTPPAESRKPVTAKPS